MACLQEMKRLWHTQEPNVNGERLGRWALIRNTAQQLADTTLKTFEQWFPEQIAKVTRSPNLRANVKYKLPDGTTVKVECLFIALDQPKDVRKLLSLELSGVFMNEASQIDYSVVDGARGRVGRYPSKVDGYSDEQCVKTECPHTKQTIYSACTRKAVLLDTNPPNNTHWWYHLDVNGHLPDVAEDERERARIQTNEIFEFFNSPSPLLKSKDGKYVPNPEADNITCLPGGYNYYLDMIAGSGADYINVMVLGNYGMLKTGKQVYPDYNDMLHCEEVAPIKGLPISLGWDFGLNPSCVIGQQTSHGQIRVLAELSKSGMGAREFAKTVVKPYLIQHFKGYEIRFSLADPSGNNRSEGEGLSAISIINEVMGFTTEGAPTNDPVKRVDAVTKHLTALVNGGRPAFLLDSSCSTLRDGFLGAYCYTRMNVSGEQYKDKPNKNQYSHLQDALQYLVLGYINGFDSARVIKDDYEAPELNGGY